MCGMTVNSERLLNCTMQHCCQGGPHCPYHPPPVCPPDLCEVQVVQQVLLDASLVLGVQHLLNIATHSLGDVVNILGLDHSLDVVLQHTREVVLEDTQASARHSTRGCCTSMQIPSLIFEPSVPVHTVSMDATQTLQSAA